MGILIRLGLLFIGVLAILYGILLILWAEFLLQKALSPIFFICGISLILIAYVINFDGGTGR